jgi:hypothetical protein
MNRTFIYVALFALAVVAIAVVSTRVKVIG